MRIAVLVKPVAQIESAQFNEDYSIKREGSRHTLSFADAYALSLARRIKKESEGGEVVVLSMASHGQLALLESLKTYDITTLYHLCDPAFAKSDTLCTAYILSEAIRKIGPFDLILAGKKSSDSETGQVPAQVATLLDIPFVSAVSDFTVGSETVECTRYTEEYKEVFSAVPPLCLSVLSKGQELTPPSLQELRAARGIPTVTLTNKELAIREASIGLEGSPTYVHKCTKNELGQREALRIKDAKEGAQCIWDAVAVVLAQRPGSETRGVIARPVTESGATTVQVLCFTFDESSVQTAREILSQTTYLGRQAKVLAVGDALTEEQIQQFRSAGAFAIECIRTIDTLDDRGFAELIESHLDPATEILFAGATERMRSSIAVLAAKTQSGLAADCTDFHFDGAALSVSRPTFGGNLEAVIGIRSPLQIATIRPKAFPIRSFAHVEIPPVTERGSTPPCGGATLISRESFGEEVAGKLPIVFSIGNGVTDPQLRKKIFGFGFLQGASRVAVNAYGYDYSIQVGQTGHIVSPALYVGFGIHGAFQHVVGIKQSQKIIAVNTNPLAPIFDYADVAICADVAEVIEHLEALGPIKVHDKVKEKQDV